jgi:hypothetical protein
MRFTLLPYIGMSGFVVNHFCQIERAIEKIGLELGTDLSLPGFKRWLGPSLIFR